MSGADELTRGGIREGFYEDLEFLIKMGEWPDRIAKRLGYRHADSLNKLLQKHGRHDLTAKLRLLDQSSLAYQLAHNTPMDEEVTERRRRAEGKKT